MTGVRAKRIRNMESKWAVCSVGWGTERLERLAGPSLPPAPWGLHKAFNFCPMLQTIVAQYFSVW